jgi:hypothetical protein
VLSEMNWAPKDKYCTISLICRIKKVELMKVNGGYKGCGRVVEMLVKGYKIPSRYRNKLNKYIIQHGDDNK